MSVDDKIFEFIVLEPDKFESLKTAIQQACYAHGKAKIRSALISQIVVDANDCQDEADLKKFIEYYPAFYKVCKVHLQYPHDVLFPAEVECASENVRTRKLCYGFLYNYKFMHTTTLFENQNENDSLMSDMFCEIGNMFSKKKYHRIEYPHSNWYHDQESVRFTLPHKADQPFDYKLQFEYSSFIKIFVHQMEQKEEVGKASGDFNDIFGGLDFNQPNPNQMTLTIGIGYPPEIVKGGGPQKAKFSRIFDFSNEGFLAPLIRSSTIQLKISFTSDKQCRNFLSHLHYAVSCPIVFLSQPFEVENINVPVLAEISPHLSWEIRYGIQMIKDCGNIGIYHFQKQNYIQKVVALVIQGKTAEAIAYLSAIHVNLKLQPLMEVIEEPRPVSMNIGEDFILMRTVIITPTRTICCPPLPLMSSRAFRFLEKDEKFIQVKFRDEDMQMMKRDKEMMEQVVLKPGLDGIDVAGRRFFDLARSSSMFREHGSYFYQTSRKEKIIDILKSLGNFKPEPCSKTAARVGQYFTSTREVKHKLEPHEYTVISDYMSRDGKFCFSDGVGIISQIFAKQIQEELNIPYLPSAFQIRFLGFKGVLSIDDKNPLLIDAGGDKLVLFRESQKKFDVSSKMEAILGIVKYSAPGTVRLNKPLLNLWDQAASKQELTHVVENRVNKLFSDNLYNITSPLTCNNKFKESLRSLPTYINFQRTVRQVWINEPFFRSMVTASALQQLRALQFHKQISLPNNLGRSMLGIVDISGILKEGQVFVQYSKQIGAWNNDGEKIICTGKKHSELKTCVAVDFLFRAENHFFQKSEYATDYTPTKKNDAVHQIEELPERCAHFRLEYMLNDFLAKISNCHLAHSDLHGLEQQQVAAMAQNADLAVNYFKSGIPAKDIGEGDMCDWYPDFMGKEHLPSYVSPRLLGKLHRICDRFWNVTMNIVNENKYAKVPIDPAYDIKGWQNYEAEAKDMYKGYNSEIEHLKSTYGIKTEGELFSNQLGAILGRLRNFDADNSTANTTKSLIQMRVSEIFRKYRNQFFSLIGQNKDSGNSNTHFLECVSEKAKRLAVAFYNVAYNDGGSLSFPWIAWEALDAVWMTNDAVVSPQPMYDLVDKEFASNDFDVRQSLYSTKFDRQINLWLNKLDSTIQTPDVNILLKYFVNFGIKSEKYAENESSHVFNFGQKLVEFFASIGSFDFLEKIPDLKAIHEAAQDTYCRIVFAPFTLNKPNAFKQRKVRCRAFVIAIPQELKMAFQGMKDKLKSESGCSQISFRVKKQNKVHVHFYVWSQGTLQQNETLKEILTILPCVQPSMSFAEVRAYKHKLQKEKVFQ